MLMAYLLAALIGHPLLWLWKGVKWIKKELCPRRDGPA